MAFPTRLRIAIALLFLGATALTAPAANAAPLTRAEYILRTEKALATKINAVRRARGLRPLRVVPRITRAARRHSLTMARTGSLTHAGFSRRINALQIRRLRTAGENVAYVNGCRRSTALVTIRMWMRSPGHRANILSPRYRWLGVGAAIRGRCAGTYLTANFIG